MILFIAGIFLGCLLGVVIMCLCTAAGEVDKQMGLK